MNKKIGIALLMVIVSLLLSNCNYENTVQQKNKIPGYSYRLFDKTPLSDLAKAVESQDTSTIRKISKKNTIDYQEPRYGQTLLRLAVFNGHIKSVQALLERGADPNKQSGTDKKSAFMEAAGSLEEKDPHIASTKYLKLLLKFGADPNAVQDGDNMKAGQKSYLTPLEFACLSGNFQNVVELITAGANVNLYSKNGFSPIYASIVSRRPYITLLLLRNGARYDLPMFTKVTEQKIYILDAIDSIWQFEPQSPEFKQETQVKIFIRTHPQYRTATAHSG